MNERIMIPTERIMFAVNAVTLDGVTNHQLVRIDSRVVAYGESGSVEFRSRAESGRILYIVVVHGVGISTIDIMLFQGRLRVDTNYPQGQCVRKF
jgi:hypothetical protein